MNRSENLQGLENLLSEFFSPTASNERKREIEKMLESFLQQEEAWKECLFFLGKSSNPYVCMFSLTSLEKVIQRRWQSMVASDKAEIRTELNNFLCNSLTSSPPFIRNKLMKIIVDIAKTDWPHFYPDFFPQMLQLVHGQTTRSGGLTMLLIACEELATPREDISTSRAVELRKLMNQQVSHISLVLTNLLEMVLDRDPSGSGVNTPPPSPSLSGESEDSNSMDGPVSAHSPLHAGSLLNLASAKVLSNHSSRKSSPVVSLPLDQESTQIVSLCLKILSHIFGWCHLPTAVNSRVISALFQYASLTIKIKGTDQAVSEISVLAMAAVNEIMGKNYIPLDFQDYLVSVYRGTFHILQGLVQETDGQPVGIQSLDEAFVEKITEFLNHFVSAHLRRCDNTAQFPLLDFLSLIFQYTFQQQNTQAFCSCLEIWTSLVDYIQGSMEVHKDTGQILLARYKEALLSVIYELLKKMQFRYNSRQLLDLDTTAVDDNSETEWQQFLIAAVETIMKVAELLPVEVLGMTDTVWKETCLLYLQLDKHVLHTEEGRVFTLATEEEWQKLHFTLRDFSSLLHLFGRMSALFLGEHFVERLPAGLESVKQLLALAAFGSRTRLYSCRLDRPEVVAALLDVQAQILAALKAWCHWLAALHSESLSDSSYTWPCSDITSKIVSAVVAVVKDGDNEKLVHAAAHFMVTLTGTVRPPSIWKLKEFTDLYSSIGHLRLSEDAHRLLVRSLCNVLLLSWPGLQEQKWEDRKKHLTKFLRDLTENFRSLKTNPNFTTDKELQKQAEPFVIHTLKMLGDLVENILNEVTQTKKLCYETVRDYIDISLWLFPLYVNSTQVCEEMFHFFHIVFDVLKSQMGAAYVEHAVQTFLFLFGEQQLAEAIVKGGSTGSRLVERFLSILTFIVSEPSPTFRKFVPSTLTLCLEHIFPLVAEQPASDIRGPMYNLLYHTLINNWQYFFKSSLGALRNPGSVQNECVENREIFLQALRAIGHSFLQPDIGVFRQNLQALEQLNARWKLYSRPVFGETLLAEFLTVFLQVLVAKSHNLLREEIGLTVYNMAATDFPGFFSNFLPAFLTATGQLDDNQRQILAAAFRQDTDLPTFAASLDRFVTDLRVYQTLNSSLPSGAVRF